MPVRVKRNDLWLLEPSTVLSVRMPNGIVHFGILSDDHESGGEPTIISASKLRGAVVEETPIEFSLGFPICAHGLWGDQTWEDTVENARANLGKPYRIFNANCEHFVRFCTGLVPESPQLQQAVGAVCFGAVALWAVARIASQ